jgi:moderate conductance mechanosensitive channel
VIEVTATIVGSPDAPGAAGYRGGVLFAADQPQWMDTLDRWHLLIPLRLLAICVAALILSWLTRRLVRRAINYVVNLAPLTDDERAGPRAKSLATVLRAGIVGVIWTIAVVAILSSLGINMGGAVAAASIIGGALAFGAQSLVRDIVAGFFVLAEDQYGVGDTIDIGAIGMPTVITGVVEKITLRTTQLRDAYGRSWHVPNGVILRVANLSAWSVAVLDTPLAFTAPLPNVETEVRRLVDVLLTEERAGPLAVDDPEFVGITDIRDDRYTYRVTVRTAPGRYDEVRRMWRQLVLDAYQNGTLSAPAAPDPTTAAPPVSGGDTQGL